MKKLFIILSVTLLGLSLNAQKAKKVKPAKEAKVTEAISVAPVSKDPSIYLESDVVDYGIINKGAEGTRTFKVSNRGSQPLLLTNCSGSCGCTVPTCPREPILPGKSAEISVKYDTNRVGPISKSVSITSNDPANPNKVVMVKGEVKDAPAAP